MSSENDNIYENLLGYWPLLVSAVLLAVYLILLLHTVSRDEGAFLLMGQGILDGKIPYVDYIDHKPPGIYYFSAAFLAVYDHPVWVRLGVLSVTVATAGGLFSLGREYFGRQVGTASALLYVLGVLLYQGFYVLTEQFVALFSVMLLLLLFRVEVGDDSTSDGVLLFGIGVCAGSGILFKQTGGALMIGTGLFYMSQGGFARFFRKTFTIGVGATVPVGAVAGYFYLVGGFREMVHWVVSVHLPGGSYGSSGVFGLFWGNVSNVGRFPLLWVLVLVSVVGYVQLRREYRVRYRILAWLGVASALPLLVRTYPHYWIQVLPFAAILGPVAFVHYRDTVLSGVNGSTLRAVLVLVFVLLSIPSGAIIVQDGSGVLSGSDIHEDYRVGEYVRNETAPSERILALTAEPKVYYLSDREPLSGNIYFLPANRGAYDEGSIVASVRSEEPPVVVIRPPCRDYVERACEYVRSHYSVTREFESYVVYEYTASDG